MLSFRSSRNSSANALNAPASRVLAVIVDDRGNAGDVCLGDIRDIRGPLFPIQPAAAFMDQFGIDGPLDFTDLELNDRLHSLVG